MRHIITLVLCLFFTVAAPAQQHEKYARARIHLDGKAHTITDLAALGLAVDHGEYKKNTFFTSDFSMHEIKAARKAGFKVDILIRDVSKYYRDQNKTKSGAKTTTSTSCTPGPSVNGPSHFHLGSYGGYFTYNEMVATLDTMMHLYPNLISARSPIDSYHTIQGQPIFWVRVSNDPAVEHPEKPQMLYTGLHHAREPGSISSTIYYLWYLLENYNADPQIKSIVDNTELYFVPCVNPDGYNYNISTSPGGGGLWRKNRRDNGDGTTGVDINRNYGYNWGYDNVGSSPVTSSETYRGTAGFSEPETQAMKWMSENHHFKITLNYHTYGEDLIYPWGYIGSLQTPDSAQFQAYAAYLTQYTLYRYGTGDQTVGYVTNGDSDDWGYGEQTTKNKVLSMTPETGLATYGFYAPSSQIIPECVNNLRTNIDAATLLLPFARIAHTDEKIITSTSGYLHYSLQRLGFPDTATFTVTATSLSSGLTITGAAQVFTGLNMLQQVTDSFGYTIAAGTPNGQLLSYDLQLYNGYYYLHDTVHFYYGQHFSNTVPSTNALTDWLSVGWNTCNSIWYSAPASIGSSATGCTNYPDNSDLTVKLKDTIDLTHSLQAYLYFYGKWSIESSYDYVEAEAAPVSGGTWQPLCGRYTRVGTDYQLPGQPIYDGQQPGWVQEELDLHDFLGQKIALRFELVSDAGVNYQGFYFDDLNVITVEDTFTAAVQNLNSSENSVTVYPNPANEQFTIAVRGYDLSQAMNGQLFDCTGRKVLDVNITTSKTIVDTHILPAGIYYLKTEWSGGTLPVTKIVIN